MDPIVPKRLIGTHYRIWRFDASLLLIPDEVSVIRESRIDETHIAEEPGRLLE